MIVNNITRMLSARRIAHKCYETSDEKLGALETANFLNIEPKLVYKTIVVLRNKPGKPILAVIPGPNRVDLKLLAHGLGEKKLTLATEREAEQLTGMLVGGISPLGLINKGFHVIVDIEIESLHEIHISGGQRGLNICMPVSAFIHLTNAIKLKASKQEK